MHQFKCVIVGDGYVGKTSMLISYTKNEFPQEYVPTVFENYNANILAHGIPYTLQLWDTAGQEDYDRLRPLSYPATQIFILCFSFERRDSFNNIKAKWLPELRHHGPTVPILLVGTKLDLRNSIISSKASKEQIAKFVTNKMGRQLAKEIRACGYVECSAKTGQNLNLVFEEAINACIYAKENRRPRKSRCRLL